MRSSKLTKNKKGDSASTFWIVTIVIAAIVLIVLVIYSGSISNVSQDSADKLSETIKGKVNSGKIGVSMKQTAEINNYFVEHFVEYENGGESARMYGELYLEQ